MTSMTRRERLTAIFEHRTPDRPAVKLWRAGRDDRLLHPDYAPVRDAARELTDLMVDFGAPFDLYCGRHRDRHVSVHEEPTDSPVWVDVVRTVQTPEGMLRSVFTRSTQNQPGYEKVYLLKDPDDIRKLLSLPYDPFEFDPETYRAADRRVGDAGIVLFGLDHAMYGLQRLVGSENFAMWSFEAEPIMLEAMATFAERIRDHARAILDSGLRPIFGWVGPELAIPPLMSVEHFRRYVFEIDQPLVDLLHHAGSRVWVHCHGRMSPVIELFADMGVDVLNPVEPPPMGDVTLDEAFAMVEDRMALEGNIETHDLMTAGESAIKSKIDACLAAATGDRRLILCPSSGYMEDPAPPPHLIENLLTYIHHGVARAEQSART